MGWVCSCIENCCPVDVACILTSISTIDALLKCIFEVNDSL